MKGYIFDLDDTLYKERQYRDSGYKTVAQHFAASCKMSSDQLYSIMKDDPSQAFETVQKLAANNKVSISITDQLIVYRSHLPKICLDEDAIITLDALRRQGCVLGLITDGRAWGQLNKIAALNIHKYIDAQFVIPTVLYGTDKHSPAPFVMMQNRMFESGVTNFAYVGDNPEKDFHFPNLMGWETFMLLDTEEKNIHEQNLGNIHPEYRPRTIIRSLRQLL